MEKKVILDEKQLAAQFQKIAQCIVENNAHIEDVVLVGIRNGGTNLARRLKNAIAQEKGMQPLLGVVDITLYRDDLSGISPAPSVGRTDLPDINGKTVILPTGIVICSAQ